MRYILFDKNGYVCEATDKNLLDKIKQLEKTHGKITFKKYDGRIYNAPKVDNEDEIYGM